MNKVDRQFVATKAVIEYQGKILLLRESTKYDEGANAGKYDTVGGRVEPGQPWKESLLREIKEETGLDVEIGDPITVHEWRPQVKGEQWQIVGIHFICTADNDQVTLSQDHDDYVWIQPEEYVDYKLNPFVDEVIRKYISIKNGK